VKLSEVNNQSFFFLLFANRLSVVPQAFNYIALVEAVCLFFTFCVVAILVKQI
jgi:hypothetical protein